MKIDNFYFIVNDIEKSIEFYTKLLDMKPSNITEKRWADWNNVNDQIYFGIISNEAAECKKNIGNNGVLGLYTDNIDYAFEISINFKRSWYFFSV